jgi:site-specific recombinase XerD
VETIEKSTCLSEQRVTALLLIGFASAMRRSELVGVRMEHLTFSPAGLEIELPVSKTDQERHGRTVFIPRSSGGHCPVKALMHWLKTAGIRTGHVFRSVNRYDGVAKQGLTPQSVALIVKAVMAQTGAKAQIFSGIACELATALPLPSKAYRPGRYVCRRGTNPMTLARYIRKSD